MIIGKISIENRKLFEKQDEQFVLNFIDGKVQLDGNPLIKDIIEELLDNGLINI